MDVAYDDSIAGDFMEARRGIGSADRGSMDREGISGQGCEDKAAARTGGAPAHGLAGDEDCFPMVHGLWRVSLLRGRDPSPGMQRGRAGKNPFPLTGGSGRRKGICPDTVKAHSEKQDA